MGIIGCAYISKDTNEQAMGARWRPLPRAWPQTRVGLDPPLPNPHVNEDIVSERGFLQLAYLLVGNLSTFCFIQ